MQSIKIESIESMERRILAEMQGFFDKKKRRYEV